jgi:RNA polymerase nonessential primary-like sigma factor
MVRSVASSDLIRAYLQEIGRTQLLSPEEELLLARQVQRRQRLLQQGGADGDATISAAMDAAERRQILHQGRRAKERMVQANLRLVVSVARKYQQRGLELLDLIQEGSLGLERAVERFDPTRGFRFSTYAYWWIRQSISRALANQSRTIRLPAHIGDKRNRIRRAQQELRASLGREATIDELAARTDLSEDGVRSSLAQLPQTISLDSRVGPDRDTPLGDLLEDPHPGAEESLALSQLQEAIHAVLQELNGREAEVIRERFGLGDHTPQTLSEIGERLQLSRERVRQIETHALIKLRQPQHRCKLRDHLRSLV